MQKATEMSFGGSFCSSTLGRKMIVGGSGLALSVFVLTHMLGNLLIFVSPQAYNEYGHALTSTPLLYIAELGLVVFFSAHVILALLLTYRNWSARPQGYAVAATGDKQTSLVQKTLWAQGIIIFVFVILHLLTFKFGEIYWVNYGGGDIRDLHRLVTEVFQSPIYVGWYIGCLILLGLHLGHGVTSTFQTLGFHHPRYQNGLWWLGRLYASIVSVGFISQPIYVYLFFKG